MTPMIAAIRIALASGIGLTEPARNARAAATYRYAPYMPHATPASAMTVPNVVESDGDVECVCVTTANSRVNREKRAMTNPKPTNASAVRA